MLLMVAVMIVAAKHAEMQRKAARQTVNLQVRIKSIRFFNHFWFISHATVSTGDWRKSLWKNIRMLMCRCKREVQEQVFRKCLKGSANRQLRCLC